MKDGIELYEVEGEALDNAWIAKNREMLDNHVIEDMRVNGYVPVLDKEGTFSHTFNAETETFTFKIGFYGYKVGERAHEYFGILCTDGILVSKDHKRVALCDAEGF